MTEGDVPGGPAHHRRWGRRSATRLVLGTGPTGLCRSLSMAPWVRAGSNDRPGAWAGMGGPRLRRGARAVGWAARPTARWRAGGGSWSAVHIAAVGIKSEDVPHLAKVRSRVLTYVIT